MGPVGLRRLLAGSRETQYAESLELELEPKWLRRINIFVPQGVEVASHMMCMKKQGNQGSSLKLDMPDPFPVRRYGMTNSQWVRVPRSKSMPTGTSILLV